jgi:hypothetical protein
MDNGAGVGIGNGVAFRLGETFYLPVGNSGRFNRATPCGETRSRARGWQSGRCSSRFGRARHDAAPFLSNFTG